MLFELTEATGIKISQISPPLAYVLITKSPPSICIEHKPYAYILASTNIFLLLFLFLIITVMAEVSSQLKEVWGYNIDMDGAYI